MKRISPERITLAMSLTILVIAGACSIDASDRIRGSGDAVLDNRAITEFDELQLSGEGRVEFGTGTEGSIQIEIDDNLLEYIETDVDDGRLVIKTRSSVDIDPRTDIVYRVGCPAMQMVLLNGAGMIDLAACVSDSGSTIELAGAGTVFARGIDTERLAVEMPGAGQIVLSGRAAELDVVLSGAGEIEAGELAARTVTVVTSGAGTTTVRASDELDVTLSGSGSVHYFGEPRVTSTITGAGTVGPA